ncbi:hypothetical protein BJ742DRAFT_775098 [Cladochytrium replicatum]|nr:hypothetical protein BJ742DRAFT_775098 [Cladochytrium replicatum]
MRAFGDSLGGVDELNRLALDPPVGSSEGHHQFVKVLEWWKASGLEVQWTQKAVDCAENADVLKWWVQSCLEVKNSDEAMDSASASGRLRIGLVDFERTKARWSKSVMDCGRAPEDP